jgi:DNA-directed RNA polymerase sigma subunit (sigma70/sigma32)
MSTSFQSYLNEIARYPLLSAEQEIQYGRRIAKMRELQQIERTLTDAEQRLVRSGQRARERFMQCNLQLVVHVAKKYENRRRKSLEIMGPLSRKVILDLLERSNYSIRQRL